MKNSQLKRKKSDKQKVFFNTLFNAGGTIIDKLLFFLVNIMMTRYLTVQDFGEYTTSLGYATFFSTFCDIGINATLIRSLRLNKAKKDENVTNNLLIKSCLSIITYCIMAVSLYFTNYNETVINLTLLYGVVRVGNEFMNAFYAVQYAEEKFLRQSIINSSFSLIYAITTGLIIILNGNNFHFAISRMMIVIIYVTFLLIALLSRFNIKFDFLSFKYFSVQAFYFGLSKIFNNALNRINIVILSLITGSLYTGIFNNGYLFFHSIFFIPSNFSTVLLAYLYKISFKENPKKFQFAFDIYTKMLSIISFYIMIIFILYAEPIIKFIYGTRYLPSVPIVQIVALAIPALFNVSGIIITALDKQKFSAYIQGMACLINIAANIIFIKYFKAEGAAIATVLTYYVLNLMYNIFLVRYKYISMKSTTFVILKQCFIFLVVYELYFTFLIRYHIIYNIILITVIYVVLVFIFQIKKNDIRIMREIVGI